MRCVAISHLTADQGEHTPRLDLETEGIGPFIHGESSFGDSSRMLKPAGQLERCSVRGQPRRLHRIAPIIGSCRHMPKSERVAYSALVQLADHVGDLDLILGKGQFIPRHSGTVYRVIDDSVQPVHITGHGLGECQGHIGRDSCHVARPIVGKDLKGCFPSVNKVSPDGRDDRPLVFEPSTLLIDPEAAGRDFEKGTGVADSTESESKVLGSHGHDFRKGFRVRVML
jgi:hypothetical protein